MFTKAGILELHATTHERLDLLLSHAATLPEDLLRKPRFSYLQLFATLSGSGS
jgi:hypothetical protein